MDITDSQWEAIKHHFPVKEAEPGAGRLRIPVGCLMVFYGYAVQAHPGKICLTDTLLIRLATAIFNTGTNRMCGIKFCLGWLSTFEKKRR